MRREGISSPRWSWVVLALLCVGAIVAAVLVVGPTSSSQASRARTVTAEKGVVQSTVSGSGSLQVQETDVNFADSGQLVEVKVKPGQHVVEGQVLARIKSNDQRLALDQAEANLTSAEAKLRQAEASASASTTTQTSAVATASAKQGPTGTSGPSGSGGGGNSGAATPAAATPAAATPAAARTSPRRRTPPPPRPPTRRTSPRRRRAWTALRRPWTAPSRRSRPPS